MTGEFQFGNSFLWNQQNCSSEGRCHSMVKVVLSNTNLEAGVWADNSIDAETLNRCQLLIFMEL